VTILNESHFPDWNVSEFRIMRGDTVRTIRHFHFTTWPDFGVPEPPQTLVRFVRAFRERVSAEQRPIVVHCSAGVGRSGTFIALDRILQVTDNEINHQYSEFLLLFWWLFKFYYLEEISEGTLLLLYLCCVEINYFKQFQIS
jgi:protein tyrosine phosphatase